MRRIVWSTMALSLVTVAPAAAQFGGIGGFNSANVSLSDETDIPNKKARSGLAAGLWGMLPLGTGFGLELDALYSQQGFAFEESGITGTLKTDYFQIPLLGKVLVPTGGNARPVFFLGPAVSFEASCKIGASSGTISADIECDDPDSEFDLPRKKTDFSLVGGAGLDFLVGNLILGAEVRYDLGLSNIIDDPTGTDSAKHRVLQILGRIGIGPATN